MNLNRLEYPAHMVRLTTPVNSGNTQAPRVGVDCPLPPALDTIGPMQVRVLAFVLAGGKGTRLYPLTKERAKPAVPFGGRYRIIDFVLSNLINSGIYSIYVLLQFKSQSLLQHLRDGWDLGGMLRSNFIIP